MFFAAMTRLGKGLCVIMMDDDDDRGITNMELCLSVEKFPN
jgi:hypothetical protein